MRRLSPLAALAAAALVLSLARAAEPDWAATEKDALELLRDLVRQDTQSGNETKLLERVKERLARQGLAPTIIEELPGRGSLIVRLSSRKNDKALLLMAHVDTVKADKAEGWSADPLGAEIKNGELVGRGVLDDKGQA